MTDGAGAAEERRPLRAVGRQEWRDLVFLHWAFSPEAIHPLVPAPLELDLHGGTAWVGIVAFRVERLVVSPWPLRLRFLETNVRTYVSLAGEPAVLFLSLDAASPLAALGGRALYRLPYHAARMRSSRSDDIVEYAHGRRGRSRAVFRVRCRIGEEVGIAAPGTLEHFLVERYRFQVVRRGRLRTTDVRHAPYSLSAVRVEALEETLLATASVPTPRGPPLAHFSPGVEVELLATRATRWRPVAPGLA